MKLHSWNGRRVLVTGHTGFKGAWLCLWLARLGARVAGLALPPRTDRDVYVSAGVEAEVESIIADVRDADAVARAVRQTKPDVVFHLAAQPLVRASYSNPVATYAVNVMGTAHVLEAVRQCEDVQAVVSVTTDKCYDNREWTWGYREIDPLGGDDPYSSSKAAAELVTAAYRRSFFTHGAGVAVASARAGNVIGGGDFSPDRLIPDAVRAFEQGRSVLIRRPGSVRPWQHVLEPLGGYILLAEHLLRQGSRFATAYNFGPSDDDARPVREVMDVLARVWGEPARWHTDANGQNGPHEAALLRLDCSRARQQLGWRPILGLETALTWTAQWYRALLDGESSAGMLQLTLGQIEQYLSAAQGRGAGPASAGVPLSGVAS